MVSVERRRHGRSRRQSARRSPTRRSRTTLGCANSTAGRDRRPPRRRPAPGAGPRRSAADHARASSSSSRSAASRWRTSRSTRARSRRRRPRRRRSSRATASETVVGSRPNLVASFPPHVQLQLGDEVPIAVDTKNLHFFDEASRRSASLAAQLLLAIALVGVAGARLSTCPPSGAVLQSLSALPTQSSPCVAAHLLRDAGPVRERRSGERRRRVDRRPRRHRLRPDRHRLLPRRRPEGPRRSTCSGSRISASPRSG